MIQHHLHYPVDQQKEVSDIKNNILNIQQQLDLPKTSLSSSSPTSTTRTTTKTCFVIVRKITGTLGKGLATLSFDIKTRQGRAESKPSFFTKTLVRI